MSKNNPVDDLKEASFNMKKYFKTPEELTKSGFSDYQMKRLKKALNKDLRNAPFLFITDFEFTEAKGAEKYPMIFTGNVNGFWKKAINSDYKRRKEFAQGTCSLVEDDSGKQKLILDIKKGKGQRDANLRLLNKVLLKRLKVTAEFAQATNNSSENGDEQASIIDTLGDTIVSQTTSVFGRIQQEVARYQKSSPDNMEARIRHLEIIRTLISEWEITYKGHKSERKEEYKQIKKLKAFLIEAQITYNPTALNKELLASFREDLKSYLLNRNEFITNAKSYKANNTTGEKLKELYNELHILDSNITDWKLTNPKPSKEELKAVGQLDSRIVIELKDLRKWLKKEGIDHNSIDPYQHKVTETKEQDARDLAKLVADTNLPALKPVSRASSTFKKLFAAYEEYGSISKEDIEMRKVKLLQITAFVNQWKKEWENKSSLSKKLSNAKKEKVEVEKIEEKLVEYLEKINAFTSKRDNYLDIINAHREFQKLKLEYKATPESEDKATYLMDNINYMIDEWQMHYTNISAFGTKKKNKKLELIRQELVDFVVQQGQQKQTDDTNAVLEQLTQNKVEENRQVLETLEEQTKKAFYDQPENKKALEAIEEERRLLEEQKLNLEKEKDGIPKETALGGIQHQLNQLNFRQTNLEAPIRKVITDKAEELNQSLIEDKKAIIEQIVVYIASKLSENADNGTFSAQLFETRDQIKKHQNILQKHQGSSSKKIQATLVDVQAKLEQLKKKERKLKKQAIQEAYPKISALAKHLAEDLAKKHQLSSEQFQEVLLKLEDHTTYLSSSLDKDAKKLCYQTAKGIINDAHFDLDNINQNIKTKLTYDYSNDEELKSIGLNANDLQKLKVTDQKERNKQLKSWYKKVNIWETKIGDYYPSPDLDQAIKDIEKYKNEIAPIKEQVKTIADLAELEKQIKVLTANQTTLKKQALDAEKKLIKASPEKKAAIVDKINQKKAQHIETTLKLKDLSLQWETAYDSISDAAFAKKKASRKEKIHLGTASFDQQLKDLNDQAKISEKHQLALTIQDKYKATNFQYNSSDNSVLKEAKQDNIKAIQKQIVAWESISVVLLREEEIQEQGADASAIKVIRDALLTEQYRYDNAVTIYKDPLFESIQKQIDKLNLEALFKDKKVLGVKINIGIIKQIYGLERLLTSWKESNATSDAQTLDKYALVRDWEAKFEAIKMSPVGIRSLEQQEFLLRAKELEDRYKKYTDLSIDISVEDLKTLKKVLVDGVQKAKAQLFLPKRANAILGKVETEFLEFERNMFLKIHEAKQKDEAKVLSLLEGCDSYDNIKDILPPEKQQAIENARDKAVQRAELILAAGGSPTEAERMLEHIPIVFWPDQFLEEMRLWRKAEALYFEKKGEEAKQEFIDSGLKEFIMNAKEAITAPMAVYNEVLASGKYQLEVKNPDGTTKKVEFNILDASHEKEVNPDGSPMKGSKIATNVLSSALDAKTAITDIKNIIDSRKDDDPEAIRKRQVMIGKVIASTTQKLCDNATKYLNTTAEGVNGPKIATAVLKSVSLLTKLILKSTEGLEDPVLAKDHFKEVFSVENAGEIVGTLLEVGAGISEIVGLFNSVGNVVGSAFGVAVNVKALIASAQKLHAAIQAKNDMRSVEERAVREDSIMLHAIRREMLTAKEEVAKGAVEVTGDSLKVVGSGTATVGAIVGLGQPAVGAGINVGGKIVEKLGDVIKISGKVVFMIRDNETKKRVKKLMKEAQTDRNARIELLENSSFFAKAYLAIGFEEGDKIAEHYCLVKGITEDDLDHEATARSILEKLIADDPTTTDEKTIGDKVQDFANNLKGIHQKYLKLNQANLQLGSVKELRPSVQSVVDTYKTLGKISTGVTVASVITTVLTSGLGQITFLGDEALEAYIEDCAEHLKELNGFLTYMTEHQDLNIKGLIQRIETLNQELDGISDNDLVLEKIQEITEREEDIRNRKLYIQEVIESKKLFAEIGIV